MIRSASIGGNGSLQTLPEPIINSVEYLLIILFLFQTEMAATELLGILQKIYTKENL